MTTILEAYGSLFDRDFHIPLIGTDNWLAFTEDFFATAVLVSLVVFTIIRIKNAPSRKERESRFYGSHLLSLIHIYHQGGVQRRTARREPQARHRRDRRDARE